MWNRRTNKRKSIQQYIMGIAVVTGVFFLALCLGIHSVTQYLLVQNAMEYMEAASWKLGSQIDYMYDKASIFAESIEGDENIRQLLTAPFSEKSAYADSMRRTITNYKLLEPAIADITLFNEDIFFSVLYGREETGRMEGLIEGNAFQWLGIQESGLSEGEGRKMFVFGGNLMDGRRKLGTYLISVEAGYFQVSSEDNGSSAYFLADKEQVLYYFQPVDGKRALDISRIWEERKGDGLSQQPIRAGSFYLQPNYIEKLGCYQAGVLDTRQIDGGMGRLKALIWGCVILAVLFIAAFFFIINHKIVAPLHQFYQLILQIRKTRKRKLAEPVRLNGCMEVEEIGLEFSGMLEDIAALNEKIFHTAEELYETKLRLYEMEVQKQEAELSYLKSQINPHFLYNTLELFCDMAAQRNAPEIGQMAVDMGKIFQYSIKGKPLVPLREEVAMIRAYVRIQKNRFKEKLEVYDMFPEDTLEIRVMKMLMQPLVENAIFHGLEPKGQKGNLFIGAMVSEGILSITIKDDGVGIARDRLQELREALGKEEEGTAHIGIQNISRRIHLQHGAEYGLTIDSVEQEGTTVVIRVPAMGFGGDGDVIG